MPDGRSVPTRHRTRPYPSKRVSVVFSCGFCGARDGRDKDHAHGCPSLPAVSLEKRLGIALAWEAACESRKARKAEIVIAAQEYAEAAHG